MLASRVAKPKLSLNISTTTAASQSSRPSLTLKSPLMLTPLRSPASPLPSSPTPISPTVRNTRLNQKGSHYYSTMSMQQQQTPTYAYANNSSSRSILKKTSSGSASQSSTRSSSTSSTSSRASSHRQLSFSESPVVYTVTPIEEPDYYGSHKKMSRDERRWGARR